MTKAKRRPKPLTAADFSGDGEPYSEVIVTISIRILGKGITRSRLAVNVYPEPALVPTARKSLEAIKNDKYGINAEGVFGACLSQNFNGWEDLEEDYPRIDEGSKDRLQKECAQAMNAYIKESVGLGSRYAQARHGRSLPQPEGNQSGRIRDVTPSACLPNPLPTLVPIQLRLDRVMRLC